MSESEKITIVEGPPPTFELVSNPWLLAMSEGPTLPYTGRCLLRTMDGTALVERCQAAWSEGRDTCLEYMSPDGETKEALILAARSGEVLSGQVLYLWLRLDAWPESFDKGARNLGTGSEDGQDFV